MNFNNLSRQILAVLAGAVAGTLINGGLINISGLIIPPPEGADMTTAEGIKAALPLLEPRHYIMPFLAHALGTLCGAFIACLIAGRQTMRPAMIIGLLFLAGGIIAASMIPAPLWFTATDLVLAYIPMAFSGFRMARLLKKD